MVRSMLAALALGTAAIPSAAAAQTAAQLPAVTGTIVDISASGEVTRVPDIALISAGVVTRASTATEAIQQNAARMERVRAALRRAGIEDRDIQTSAINLNPDYRYQEGQAPILTGYQASNSVNVRFRDIRSTGKILDALVAQGANQINGPTLMIDKPEEAMDEARTKALAVGKARAELYARSLGMRVVRLLSISESGNFAPRPPMPYGEAIMATGSRSGDRTKIDPGEQKVEVSLSMSFELR